MSNTTSAVLREEKREDPQGDGLIDVHLARADTRPGRSEEVGTGEEQHRDREGKAQVLEAFQQEVIATVGTEVLRKAEEHDVTERERGDAELHVQHAGNTRAALAALLTGTVQ
jgi:hypothetical protein